ncbi:hypothetical protein T09_4136 [Trichinella sp. T9]|nr:hypothetical protein T09_4136 [Trichinella sp. T9]
MGSNTSIYAERCIFCTYSWYFVCILYNIPNWFAF